MTTVNIKVVPTTPYTDQVMGTSGLRKKVTVATQPHYLANFIESIYLNLKDVSAATYVVGGDGRYLNDEALQQIIAIGIAHKVPRFLVAHNGRASTPAISCMIRARNASGGFLLTASHNPGGPTCDFGLKVNNPNGGPALKELTDAIYATSKTLTEYKMAELPEPVDTSKLGSITYVAADDGAKTVVEIIDPVKDYVEMAKSAFDFELISKFVKSTGLRAVIDSLNAVTGDYTHRIFVEELGFPENCLVNNVPKNDFGGGHPDPNLVYAKALVDKMYSGEYDFGAAFDGDGDRNMILGKKFFVTPSDSLAIITANNDKIRYFRENGFKGVARSMPTSAAVDKVVSKMAEENGAKIEFNETPTGWKFFGNLMDAGRLSLCGEESFGTGCDLIREKDGIWAALAWLSILAAANEGCCQDGTIKVGVEDVVRAHWKRFGRNYYSRYDYEEVDADAAKKLMETLEAKIGDICEGKVEGTSFRGHKIVKGDNFTYVDPVDKSVTKNQGIRLFFDDGSRIIFRLSGTGSVGATIRIYFDMYESDAERLNLDAQDALKELIQIALRVSDIEGFTGRKAPTVIT